MGQLRCRAAFSSCAVELRGRAPRSSCAVELRGRAALPSCDAELWCCRFVLPSGQAGGQPHGQAVRQPPRGQWRTTSSWKTLRTTSRTTSQTSFCRHPRLSHQVVPRTSAAELRARERAQRGDLRRHQGALEGVCNCACRFSAALPLPQENKKMRLDSAKGVLQTRSGKCYRG